MSFQCTYCSKSFSKEKTLFNHVCERKRRFQQENEIGVQWGYLSYAKFYSMSQKTQTPSYKDFVYSNYYTAFVKFGRYCHSVHCVNFERFLQWLLKNNKKIDQWCNDNLYAEWLTEYVRKENVKDALERSMLTLVNYMQEHPEYLNGFRDYFRLVNSNRICYHISTGRISPWLVFNCTSGQDFLSKLGDDQIANIISFIDTDFWQTKFNDYPEDVVFCRQVLDQAGL